MAICHRAELDIPPVSAASVEARLVAAAHAELGEATRVEIPFAALAEVFGDAYAGVVTHGFHEVPIVVLGAYAIGSCSRHGKKAPECRARPRVFCSSAHRVPSVVNLHVIQQIDGSMKERATTACREGGEMARRREGEKEIVSMKEGERPRGKGRMEGEAYA